MRRSPLLALAAAIALVPTLAGCTQQPSGPEEADDGLPVVPVPVHVVLVGPHPDLDRAALLDGLPNGTHATLYVQSLSTGVLERVPYKTAATWTLHEAPAAFTDEVFAKMADLAKPAAPTGWLLDYDINGGQHRLCQACQPMPAQEAIDDVNAETGLPRGLTGGVVPPVPRNVPEQSVDPVMRVDARALEDWIESVRADYGLRFEPHAATVFLFDHHSGGRLPSDTYYQYAFDDGTGISITQTMRAWGGTYDFVWLDRSAAPDSFDYRPWLVFGEEDDGLNGRIDAPIWDLAGDVRQATENVRAHLVDFYHLRAAREPLYAPHALDRIDVRVHFFIDEQATMNPGSPAGRFLAAGGPAMFDAEHIRASMATLAPWVDWRVELKTVNLPDDDPGFAAALRQAKVEGGGSLGLGLGVLQKYFREHYDDYAPRVPGGRTYPVSFIVSDTVTATHPLAFGGGVALGNQRGAGFVAYAAFADSELCPTRLDRVVCFFDDLSASPSSFYTNYITHEAGHDIAMRHPHDREGQQDWEAARLNSLWDSTLTAMTYRHWSPGFDTFDRRYYAAHTAAMRLAASPDHPAAAAVHRLLEEGRVEEAAREAQRMPVAYDPHDRPLVPQPAGQDSTSMAIRPGEPSSMMLQPPATARWARIWVEGSASPLTYSCLVEADGDAIACDEGNHRDTHYLALDPAQSYTLEVGFSGLVGPGAGVGQVTARVEYFDTDPLLQAE